jgi:uncharacterized protein YodC (DUF2158 family)
MNEFKIGDVVQLKSGGPPMTIARFLENGAAVCVWFNEGKPEQKGFATPLLVPVRSSKS